MTSRLVVWVILATAAEAAAQPEPAPEPTSKLWLGGQLDLLASGTFTAAVGNQELNIDADSTVAFEGLLDYRVSPLVTIGLAPRFIPSARPHNLNSGSEYDLRARATVGDFVAPRVRLHGIGELGYSFISHVYSVGNNQYETTKGLVLALGVGAAFTINARMLATAEISYQWGFQGTTYMGTDVTGESKWLTFGGGIVFAVGD